MYAVILTRTRIRACLHFVIKCHAIVMLTSMFYCVRSLASHAHGLIGAPLRL